MAKESNHIIGVEISEKGYKFVQRDIAKNEIVLMHADIFPASPVEDGTVLYKAFKDCLKHCRKALKTRDAVVSVPLSVSQVRFLQLDSALGDMRSQILWEMEQQAIGRSIEPVVDWIPLDEKNGNVTDVAASAKSDDVPISTDGVVEDDVSELSSKVSTEAAYIPAVYLYAATSRQMLSSWLASLKKAGIVPQICDIDAMALFNVFDTGYPEERQVSTILLDISPERLLVVWTINGKLVDSDSIVGLDWSGAESASRSIVKIKQRIKDMSEGHSSVKAPEMFYLSGEIAADSRLRDIVLAETGLNGELLDPFRAVAAGEEIQSQASLYGSAFAVAVGLSLRGTGE